MAAANAMEIFSQLNKSNCRECGEKTCLAFAGAVFTGRRSIHDCPHLAAEVKIRLAAAGDQQPSTAAEEETAELRALVDQLKKLDLDEAAARCGGVAKNGKLCVRILGKELRVDGEGNFSSDIHINPWVVAPFLAYAVHGKGMEPTGKWVSYREIKGGRERYGLFRKRCEEDMRKIADSWPDLFRDMVEIFQGREVESQFAADVSVVLLPLPRVPIMICYWQSDEGLESTLNIFFDETVDDNLGNDGIYSLCAGLTTMFGKLAERHGCRTG